MYIFRASDGDRKKTGTENLKFGWLISDSTCPKITPWVLPDPSPLCMLRRMVISETEEK